MLSSHETANRLRAARALANLSVEELAERLGPGLSAKTIGNMEREQRPARSQDLRAIAHACGLPYEFFTVDFGDLPAIDGGAVSTDEVAVVARLVRELGARMDAQQADLDELRQTLALDALADGATPTDASTRESAPATVGKGRRGPRRGDGR